MKEFRDGDIVKYIPSGHTFAVCSANEVNVMDNHGHWYEVDKIEMVKRTPTYEELEEERDKLRSVIKRAWNAQDIPTKNRILETMVDDGEKT